MYILYIIFAILISSIFSFLYIRIYSKFFELRKYYYLGLILFLFTICVQFFDGITFRYYCGVFGVTFFYNLSIGAFTHF